uniref:Carbonyl reductase n=1 Tax=Panagrolaimus sp. ES5 TaxID=591445 RepID=A0AC34FYW8_9BILA
MPQLFINSESQKSGQVFVVTGANRGVGYGIVETLAKTVENGIIYITALEESDGKKAVEKLRKSLGERKKSELRFHQLDITSVESCQKFANHLHECHGTIDVLINNAGVGFYLDQIKSLDEKIEKGWLSMNVNYFGTKQITLALIPLLKSGGRVVNVCSQLGKIQNYKPKYALKLKNASNYEEIEEVIDLYMGCVKEETCTKNGFQESPYRVSKAAEIALTILHGKIFKDTGIKFYACCPGYVNTAMTLFQGTLTIQEGADTPAYLATNPNAPHGVLCFNRKIVEW